MIGQPRSRLNLIEFKVLEKVDNLLPIGLKELIMTLINAKNSIHN